MSHRRTFIITFRHQEHTGTNQLLRAGLIGGEDGRGGEGQGNGIGTGPSVL